ncbi:TetR/AcrR family transcriptional regulator [Nocardioides nanhaiensis]|uniref:HTH tetR-type domain-containing protein n=1 Tax=Nocardioides nanhaiensis TaxID=1476871 RepID=A0ABP8W7K0_9ACTN
MARSLVDLLWRDHPEAPRGGSRGPESRVSTGEVVAAALDLADSGGLAEVTVRRLGAHLGISAMSVYTHVGSRDDLLVLMADAAHAQMDLPAFGRAGWRTRCRRVAEANRAQLLARAWLLDVDDDRTVLGPGTIAKYDHELQAFEGLGLDDVARDAALTLLLDLARSSARVARRRPTTGTNVGAEEWARWGPALGRYLGDAHPLAQRVGGAAGAAMGAASSPDHAWRFALERVLDGLSSLGR